ncbi:MAG: glycosyltransferase family 2 protein [Planctomycetes bacterium]|nr:glycosyltransferase family 2 protein [Planctomycetota bacterium]
MEASTPGAAPSLSVVLPAYNESHRLPRTLDEIRPFLDGRLSRYEVIVVDDGSTDGMAAVVEERARTWPALRLLRQPRNLGKGAAVRRGCLSAREELVLFMDADHATPIEEVLPMIGMLVASGYGAAVGCRTYQEDESKWRRIAGLGLQILAHLIVFKKAVVDSQCGFKVFTRDACKILFSRCRVDGGMIDVELFFLMHKLGVPCYYHPVHWHNKEGSRINILKCILFDPIDLAQVRMRDLRGGYEHEVSSGMQPWER